MSADLQMLHRVELVVRTMLGQDPTPAAITQALAVAGLLGPAVPDVVIWRAEVATIPLGLYASAAAARAHCLDHYRQQLGQAPRLAWYEEGPEDDLPGPFRLHATHEGVEAETPYRAVPLAAWAEYDPERGE
ncbi:hypothetical protein [Streptomyces sp. CB03911]|uniref:hypothetical protein n=1 Tax=Streptomyces sp. CB03911 TaxID=1804758 RepID=UPI00093BF29B|nr:hypothetical protein [Streptomyces sp. CB03911]OKI22232.1 hypothetical protein A6A07_34730 [Streptomyces sp. CB03911]